MYDSAGFFVPNKAHIYLINNRSHVHYNADGIARHLHPAERAAERAAAPQLAALTRRRPFRLIMRLYKPIDVRRDHQRHELAAADRAAMPADRHDRRRRRLRELNPGPVTEPPRPEAPRGPSSGRARSTATRRTAGSCRSPSARCPGRPSRSGSLAPGAHTPNRNGCGVASNPRAWSELKPSCPVSATVNIQPEPTVPKALRAGSASPCHCESGPRSGPFRAAAGGR